MSTTKETIGSKEAKGLADISDDLVLPFSAEGLETRGRIVRLGPVVDQILRRHDYPESVSRMLGEAIVLAAILGTNLKFEGRLILQTQSDGPVSMIVVDFEAPDRLRAWAKFDAPAIKALAGSNPAPGVLLGKGHLALTLDYGREQTQYQGLVPLDNNSLSEAADLYFQKSEQIPTRVRLAVAENIVPDGDTNIRQWRAGGILIQYLPETGGIPRRPDLSPGDIPLGSEVLDSDDEPDAWLEANALANTIEDVELTDPGLAPEQLLYRLFHEKGVRVFEGQLLRDICRCSEDRVRNMLHQFSAEERADMIADGEMYVVCEFCSTRYDFDPREFE